MDEAGLRDVEVCGWHHLHARSGGEMVSQGAECALKFRGQRWFEHVKRRDERGALMRVSGDEVPAADRRAG